MTKRIFYRAPKPKLKNRSKFKKIASLVFPPTALWKGVKYSVNKMLGKKVGLWINPAQRNYRLRLEAIYYRSNFLQTIRDKPVTVEEGIVQTYDNSNLDTMIIYPATNTNTAQPHILYFSGSRTCFEYRLDAMLDDALRLNAKVIGFNYRGVCESGDNLARSKYDNIIDGIAQVQRLIDQGIPPNNIFLKGDSYGGSVVAAVAKYFHANNLKINMMSIRTFSTMTDELVGLFRIGRFSEKHVEVKHIHGATLSKPFIKLLLTTSGWDVNTISAYNCIPDENKDYIVVRSQKSRRHYVDDCVIPYPSSLHAGLRVERKKLKKTHLKTSGVVPEELKSTFSARKFMTESSSQDGHIESLFALQNRYGVNAHHFFQQFVCKLADIEVQPDKTGDFTIFRIP